MNKEKQHKKLVPELRFSEFVGDGDWEVMTLGETSKWHSGGTPSKANESYWNGEIPWISAASMRGKYYNDSNRKVTESGVKNGTRIAPENSVLLLVRGSMLYKKIPVGITNRNVAFNQDLKCLIVKPNINVEYLYYFISASEHFFMSKVSGTGIGAGKLDTGILKNIKFYHPNPKEQQKIANCLSSLDNLITAETEKLDHLKDHKKGLLQQLFPANGETVPQFRFPEFVKDGDWEEKELEDCLDYLQPTKYLVQNTNYNNSYLTPVLTAGKTFILGYTNEKEGVFNKNLPVIIFDDFTTATKFVDFPFKGKSSAMKILLAKNNANIKFVYESMQILKFEVGVHKRHWISIFSKLKILVPKPKEQQKIADCLSSLDDLIQSQTEKTEALKDHKKGLMQQLFPIINDVAL